MKGGNRIAEHEIEHEIRRVFRRLAEPQSHAARLDDGGFGLFVARNHWHRPVMRIEARLWAVFEARDLVRKEVRRGGAVWRPSEAGLALLRRLDAESDPFRSQHQARRRCADVEVDDAESPLAWLHRRKGPDGKPLISELQLAAGERLRRDFTLARMGPRVTTDWTMALAPGGARRAGADPADASDRALAARERVAGALKAVGPVLCDVLLAVCCHLQGLEDAERGFGWPRRAAKLVLQIALDRLAAHYGMDGGAGRRAGEGRR